MATRAAKTRKNTQMEDTMETVNQDVKVVNEPQKSFSQDEVNRMIGERLLREREKYANYDELKAKAEEYDKVQEASKSELQKAEERANQLQAKYDSMVKAEKVRTIREQISQLNDPPKMVHRSTTSFPMA